VHDSQELLGGRSCAVRACGVWGSRLLLGGAAHCLLRRTKDALPGRGSDNLDLHGDDNGNLRSEHGDHSRPAQWNPGAGRNRECSRLHLHAHVPKLRSDPGRVRGWGNHGCHLQRHEPLGPELSLVVSLVVLVAHRQPSRIMQDVQVLTRSASSALPTVRLLGHFSLVLVMTCLAVAGLLKSLDVPAFAHNLESWTFVPRRLIGPLAYTIPPLEIAIASAWFFNVARTRASVGAILLLVAFTSAYSLQLAVGERPTCGCFARLSQYVLGVERARYTIGRNLLLIAMAGWGLLYTRGPKDMKT
jgi:hypothetical protein